ncbi:MAG: carbohydrate kinase family protein [Anaerolineales bacterium]|nr:carbohydrate kinase family protein [Chloroflexota bacterium]MBL6981211.1 carbohydrate kinase family protein [Anaerolineales bacterium]
MQTVVFGNVTLDVICYPVNDVPRKESISFEKAIVSPGGCASNVAIGLATLGIPAGLVAQTGDDDPAELLFQHWDRVGVDTRFVQRTADAPTAVSVGLVDSEYQPRFVHTPGANGSLSADALDIPMLKSTGVRFLHVAGFFVLPTLFDGMLSQKLSEAKNLGLQTSLDVVFNVRMDDPTLRTYLWEAMPYIDNFLCNEYEAFRMTGIVIPEQAARALKDRGAANVIVKLGEKGCYVLGDTFTGLIAAPKADVVDTTGAGDAFAAGFIAALCRTSSLQEALNAGNQAGAHIVRKLGAIQAWLDK